MPNYSTKRSSGLSPEQKRLFRAALTYFGYTRETWSAQHDISKGYLDQIRCGFAPSDRVVGQIAATIHTFQRHVATDYLKRHPEICECV